MKPTEFIVENSIIAQEADDMHRDHEVQMARSQLYSAAQAAIQIHKLLKNVSEMEGLEGWVQTKIAVASEYLESVQDYLKYEAVSQQPEMMEFAEAAADYALDKMINEMATGGASSAGAVATSMTGPAHKRTSGVPKKIGNSYKPKKVEVGKGVY
jgi:hypothetical protein